VVVYKIQWGCEELGTRRRVWIGLTNGSGFAGFALLRAVGSGANGQSQRYGLVYGLSRETIWENLRDIANRAKPLHDSPGKSLSGTIVYSRSRKGWHPFPKCCSSLVQIPLIRDLGKVEFSPSF
jgi:hypothetical protein